MKRSGIDKTFLFNIAQCQYWMCDIQHSPGHEWQDSHAFLLLMAQDYFGK